MPAAPSVMKVAAWLAVAVVLCAARTSSARSIAGMTTVAATSSARALLQAGLPVCTAIQVTWDGVPPDQIVSGCVAADVPSANPMPSIAFTASDPSITTAPCQLPLILTGGDATPETDSCPTFRRTWRATSCENDAQGILPLVGTTQSTKYTLYPPTLPVITLPQPQPQPQQFDCQSATTWPAPTPADATAVDGCTNPISPVDKSAGPFMKTPGACSGTSTVTYTATDCRGAPAGSAFKSGTIVLTSTVSPQVTITPPASLQCTQPTCGQATTILPTTTCKLNGNSVTVATWLSTTDQPPLYTATFQCAATVGAGGSVSSTFTATATGSTTPVFPPAGIVVPSSSSTQTVGFGTWTAQNDCSSAAANSNLLLCPCRVTTCPFAIFSKGVWGTQCRSCVNGATCPTSTTCGSGTTLLTSTTLCRSVPGFTPSTLCACAGGSNNGLANYITQLAAMYLNVNCANTPAQSATPLSKAKVASLSGCGYLSSCAPGSTTITLAQVYQCSFDYATSPGADTSAVANCLGSGFIPTAEDNAGCIGLLANPGGCQNATP